MRLRLFTEYHNRGLSGFAQTNTRIILWKRTKIMLRSSDNDAWRLNLHIFWIFSTLCIEKSTLRFGDRFGPNFRLAPSKTAVTT